MPGKCRPSLRKKTLDNVMCSNLSQTDKDCIKAVFERYVEVVRCEKCKQWSRNIGIADSPNGHCFCHDIETNGYDFCSYGERRSDGKKEV